MLFSSITFLYYFLPAFLAFYALVSGKQGKNMVLLAGSLVFYAWGEPLYCFLMIGAILLSFLLARLTDSAKHRSWSLFWTVAGVISNLSLLFYFKYANFLVDHINLLFQWTGVNWSLANPKIHLPVGISFYIFQMISYQIDVCRGTVAANKKFSDYAAYVSMFPQLIAGPIVRYADIARELQERKHTLSLVYSGIRRFLIGLAKKVLIGNQMGVFITYFRQAEEPSVLFYWLYAAAFTLQIYYDFSGYSDMAIGLGNLFGFHFPENFHYPYMAASITEFWRRWHISLGTWFRDYVYIPLGGNRMAAGRHIVNLLLVWILTGLWHGASWNFALWGMLYGVLLIVEKYVLKDRLRRFHRVVSHIYVMFFVMIGFVLFNGDGLQSAVADIGNMFGLTYGGKVPFISAETLYYLRSYAILFLIAIAGTTNVPQKLCRRIDSGSKTGLVLESFALVSLLLMITGFLVDGSYHPFLYFRF